MGHADGPGHAGREPDAVIGAGDVVVHGLGDGHDVHPLLIEADRIAEGIVAADGDQIVDAQPLEVLQDLRRDVIGLHIVGRGQMRGDVRLLHLGGIGARAVQEGSAASIDGPHDIRAEGEDAAADRVPIVRIVFH